VTPPSTTCAGTRDRDRTRSSSFLPLFHRLQAPRRRRDVAEPGASSPVPRNHRNAIVIDDRLRTPRPRPPAIKGGRPCLNTPHHLAPLPLLALLAPFPLYISHHAAPISHRSSPETRKTKPSNSSTSGAAATLPRLAVVDQLVCPPRRPRWTSVSRPSPPSWPPVGLALAGARRRRGQTLAVDPPFNPTASIAPYRFGVLNAPTVDPTLSAARTASWAGPIQFPPTFKFKMV
jgi:hypothetical protein